MSYFWDKRAECPTSKSRNKSRASAECTRSAFRWRDGQLTLAKMAEPLAVVWSRPLPDGAQPSTATVSVDPAGRWHVSMLVETTVETLPPTDRTVGVDAGVTSLATLSTGEKIPNPRHELADRRRDLHKLSTRLVRENQTVVIDDLTVRNMPGNHSLARAVRDAAWRDLRGMLEYKAAWYGRDLVVVDRWFPWSKVCSACGHSATSMPLNARVWTCTGCGATHDRDVSAARNIRAEGLSVLACGDGVRPTRR